MTEADAELVARCKQGDRVALEAVYRRHVSSVWRYAWFRTRSREAASEILQETFLRVIRYIGRFDGRSALPTWLFSLTRSVAIEHIRRERLRNRITREPGVIQLMPLLSRASAGDSGGDVSAPGVDDVERDAVRAAVAELPPAQRDAIILCELSDMSIRDAAGVLGWSEGRVKSTLFRARGRLSELLVRRDIEAGSAMHTE